MKKGDGRLYWSTRGEYYSNEKKVVNAGTFQLSTARQYYKLTSMQKNGKIVYHLDPLSGPVQVGDTLAVRITVGGNAWSYLMIEDPIPSGTESIARDDLYELDEQPTWWGRWFSDRELRDDRTTFFNLYFPQGQHEYVYLLKVVNPGVFRVSPTSVQPMYQPEYLSTSDCHYGDGEMNAKHKGAAKLWLLNIVGNAALVACVYFWLLLPDAHGWQVAASACWRWWSSSSECGCARDRLRTSGLENSASTMSCGGRFVMRCDTSSHWSLWVIPLAVIEWCLISLRIYVPQFGVWFWQKSPLHFGLGGPRQVYRVSNWLLWFVIWLLPFLWLPVGSTVAAAGLKAKRMWRSLRLLKRPFIGCG